MPWNWGGFQDRLKQFARDKDLLQAAMAAGAAVANAEGGVSSAEKQKVIRFVQVHPDMKLFDQSEAIRLFQEYVEHLEFDEGSGLDRCLKECRDVTNPDKQMLVARLALAVGKADDEGGSDASGLSPKETEVFRKVLEALRVSPQEFKLR